MGDARDAGVVLLLFPGATFPILYLLKWVISRALGAKIAVISTGRIVVGSLNESAAPALAFVLLGPLLAGAGWVAPALPEERWFRIGSFLLVLLIADVAANYYVVAAARTSSHPARVVVSGSLGALSAASFPAAWIAVGHLLNTYP